MMCYNLSSYSREVLPTKLELNSSGWKRFFSVPCAIVDSWLKLADGPALKVILYMLASESEPDRQSIISATGVTEDAFDEAVSFWKSLGVISADGEALAANPSPAAEQIRPVIASRTVYRPGDIADMLSADAGLKELFQEAESTLGRLLKHADHEALINLRDYYGFTEESIVLILGYCAGLGKTSVRYYESVAKSLYEKGASDFHSIETEFERLTEQHSFESEIKRDFGLDIKLTPRQSQYISSWKEMGFSAEMISLARERCADATNKLSFPYIDKILKSWQDKGIFTPEAAETDIKPQKQDKEHSFDLDEFDLFTLGAKKEEK